MERQFLPVRLMHIILCAEMIWNKKNNTKGKHLGLHWHEGFIQCHSELALTMNKRINVQQVMAKNPAYIIEFYVLVCHITLF